MYVCCSCCLDNNELKCNSFSILKLKFVWYENFISEFWEKKLSPKSVHIKAVLSLICQAFKVTLTRTSICGMKHETFCLDIFLFDIMKRCGGEGVTEVIVL